MGWGRDQILNTGEEPSCSLLLTEGHHFKGILLFLSSLATLAVVSLKKEGEDLAWPPRLRW
jgi:hypothetical protein